VTEAPISIVLVDDTDDVRMLVRTQLRLAGGFALAGEGADGHEAIKLVAEHQPTILLVDVSMPGLDGIGALPDIIAAAPSTRVVVYSGFEEPQLAARALELGAAAFIPKSRPVADLPDELRRIAGIAKAKNAQPTADSAGAARADGWNADGVLAMHVDHSLSSSNRRPSRCQP